MPVTANKGGVRSKVGLASFDLGPAKHDGVVPVACLHSGGSFVRDLGPSGGRCRRAGGAVPSRSLRIRDMA